MSSAGRLAAAEEPPAGADISMSEGVLIVVEGPNGIGKTTVAALLAAGLRERQAKPVHLTSEPSDTPLGRLVRCGETALHGRALALAIAADRYAHLDGEVMPLLDAGTDVVCDRYVQSSLVLQRVDGLSLAEIWTYNAHVLPAAVSFCLDDDADVIGERLRIRPVLSRLELTASAGQELRLYREALQFLRGHGWEQVVVDCRGKTPDAVVAAILSALTSSSGSAS